MKAKLALCLTLVAVLALLGAGCTVAKKTTGGGWFIDDESGGRITFGFTAQPTDGLEAKGQFQLVDHGTKMRVHGTFLGTFMVSDPTESGFHGTCSINGEGDYGFLVILEDMGEPGVSAGDSVEIYVGSQPVLHYHGVLGGGNIQVHKK